MFLLPTVFHFLAKRASALLTSEPSSCIWRAQSCRDVIVVPNVTNSVINHVDLICQRQCMSDYRCAFLFISPRDLFAATLMASWTPHEVIEIKLWSHHSAQGSHYGTLYFSVFINKRKSLAVLIWVLNVLSSHTQPDAMPTIATASKLYLNKIKYFWMARMHGGNLWLYKLLPS